MAYQIAQKIHAVTDPHDPPRAINDRARDVVDLLLLRDLVTGSGHPTLTEINDAVTDIFAVRAHEAEVTGHPARERPARLTPHAHWSVSYAQAAESAQLSLPLQEATEQVNNWLAQIEDAGTPAS